MIGAKSTLFASFDTEGKVAECGNRERAPTSGEESCSRTLVEQGLKAHSGDSGPHQPGEGGSLSPDLRAVAALSPPRPAPDSQRRVIRVICARAGHTMQHRTSRVDEIQFWRNSFWHRIIQRFHPAGPPTDRGRSIRVVTPDLDLTVGSSPQCTGRVGQDSPPPS